MKRILTVLVLLVVCGLAYSVTGKVFTQFDSVSGIGLGDTGTDMNFDGFTFTYKLSAPLAGTDTPLTFKSTDFGGLSADVSSISWVEGLYDGTNTLTATSPGYFQISGVKLSDALTVALGMKWYTLGISESGSTSNLTSKENNKSIGYNSVFFEPKIVYTVNDTTTVTMDWGKDDSGFGKNIQVAFFGGSSAANAGAWTNNATVGGYQFGIPLKINTKIDTLAIEAYPYLVMVSETSVQNMKGTNAATIATNSDSVSATMLGAYLQATYPLNDSFKVQGKVSLDSYTATVNHTDLTNTNVTVRSQMPLGLFGEVIWALAPQTTVNLGLGYKIPMANTVSYKTSGGTTNLATTTALGLAGYDPIIAFGGTTKFAQNWTLGINGRMQYAPSLTAGNNQDNSGATGTNNTVVDQPVKFNNAGSGNSVNWDKGDNAKSIFIQYDIDTVSIRFEIDGTGKGIFDAGRLNLSYTY
jgi:hypothetical protein